MFADLGLSDADELLAKTDLAHAIRQLIRALGVSPRAAARASGVAQPDLSNVYRGRLDGFSIDRLCRLLTALGQDCPHRRAAQAAVAVRRETARERGSYLSAG